MSSAAAVKPPAPANRSLAGALLRLTWLVIGNAIVSLLILGMAFGHLRAISAAGLGYLAAVLAVVAARYADIRFYNGRTVDDEPASLRHWQRFALYYVCATAAIGAVVLLAQTVGQR